MVVMTHAPRRLAVFLVVVASLTAGRAIAQNSELGLANDVSDAVAGIEGEELPLPTRSQVSMATAHG